MKKQLFGCVIGCALACAAVEPVRWVDGSWDETGRPEGKLLSDNPRWFGARIFTGVTYDWEEPPTFPRDIRGHNGPPAQRLLGGATRIIEWDTVGRPGDRPIVAVFDFKRPCTFTEIDLLSERCTNATALVSFSADRAAWSAPVRREVTGALTRVRLARPAVGRYLRLSFQALPQARNTWWCKTEGYTFLDEVLVWGDGEVSARHPEKTDAIAPGSALVFTNAAPGAVSILPMPIPHLARKPGGATPARCALTLARNETESRYFAVANGTRAPVALAFAAPEFGADTTCELLIGGVVRMSPPRRRLSDAEMVQLHTNDREGVNKGSAEDLDVLPFFFPHTHLPANCMTRYLANPQQVMRFPEAVPLTPGEGCVVMLRVTTRGTRPGRRTGALAAGPARLALDLEVVDLTLPPQNMWIYAYEPFTTQFPFESARRRRRDAARYAGLGATTTRHLPEPGSKEALFFKMADNPSVGYNFEDLVKGRPAFSKIQRGQYDKTTETERRALVEDVSAVYARARALGLRREQIVGFLPDEPGPNNARDVMRMAQLLKDGGCAMPLHCDPLCYKGGSDFCSSAEIRSLFGEAYNRYVDVSCPIGMIASRPELLRTLWGAPRLVNAQYQHPAGRTGRGMVYSCHRNGFNGFAYYCYYYPNGRDPWDIRTWGVLNYNYQTVFPLEEDVALTPLYEFLREGAEENRMLEALKAHGRRALYASLLERAKTAWDRTHFQYDLMDPKQEDMLALREDILRAFRPSPSLAAPASHYAPQPLRELEVRDGIGNFLAKLNAGRDVTVAYLGSSVIGANDDAGGFRGKTTRWLRKTYPRAKVTEVCAAIGGSGSDLGVYRLGRDVLDHNPDLLFIDFASDDFGRPEQTWRDMEGIVRQVWRKDPKTDIVFTYVICACMTNEVAKGYRFKSAGVHDVLAAHYGIPSVDFAPRVWKEIVEGRMLFSSKGVDPSVLREDGDFGPKTGRRAGRCLLFSDDGAHPRSEGHDLYMISMKRFFAEAANVPAVDHAARLETPFVKDNSEKADAAEITRDMLTGDWKILPDAFNTYHWTYKVPWLREHFGREIWMTEKPGAKLAFAFKGSTCMVYDLCGPKGGLIRVTVDGQTSEKPVSRFTPYSETYRPSSLLVARGLDPSITHRIELELLPERPDKACLRDRLVKRYHKNFDEEIRTPKYDGIVWIVGRILHDGVVKMLQPPR